MQHFDIVGGNRLKGQVHISGAKNAALPIMAASILVDGETVLKNVPDLADVRQMLVLLNQLGVKAQRDPDGALRLSVQDEMNAHAEYDLVSKMRASVCVMGPLLAKRRRAQVAMPGGCAIGARPIDLHIAGLQKLGADFDLVNGDVLLKAKKLVGTEIFLGGPFGSSVTATTNVMMAAVMAEGRTIIESAACEPEVVDLAHLLNAMGAKIRGAGGPRITIEGVERLGGADHHVMPDRIEAGTYILAAAITNGEATIENCPTDSLTALLDRLGQVGVEVETVATQDATDSREGLRDTVRVASSRRLTPTAITTQPHPGFPTDLQAQMMTLLCLADGNSIITEKIFPDRFLHVAELLRMGANLTRSGPTVLVSGVRELIGAPVMASDLRASAGLVLAGLAARGTTTINRVYHLDRGYEKMEITLRKLGAEIERVDRPAV